MKRDTRALLTMVINTGLVLGMLLMPGCGGEQVKEQTWRFDQASQFGFDTGLVTVDAAGAQLKRLPDEPVWTASYQDPRPSRAPEYHQAFIGPDGTVTAVGSVTDLASRPITGELIVGKYDRAGQALPGWPVLFTDPTYRWNEGEDVAVDAAGNITIAGYSIVNGQQWYFSVWRFDPAGEMLPGWPQYPAGNHAYGTGVIMDSAGDIIACGASGPTGHEEMLVAKYRPDGTPVDGWPRAYQVEVGQKVFAYDILEDTNGDLVMVGYTEPAPDDRNAVLYKLDRNGNVLTGWPKVWDSGTGLDEYFAVSQSGNGYGIVGTSGGATEEEGKLLLTYYDMRGDQRTADGWPFVYDQPGMRDASPPDAWRGSVDSWGRLAAAFIAAAPDTGVVTVEYIPAILPEKVAGFPRTVAKPGYYTGTRSCTVDGMNNVYTVGWSYLEGGSYSDYSTWIVKYPPGAYSTGMPSVTAKQGLEYGELSGFNEQPDQGEGVFDFYYQLSPDGFAWYYHDGSAWVPARSQYDSNGAAEVDENIADFADSPGGGELYLKALIRSDGTQQPVLESVMVEYR